METRKVFLYNVRMTFWHKIYDAGFKLCTVSLDKRKKLLKKRCPEMYYDMYKS